MMSKKTNSVGDEPKRTRKRRVLFVRHGQRVDRYLAHSYQTIKRDWVDSVFPTVRALPFTSSATYRQINLEMPLYLPRRPVVKDYGDDPPLTTMGELSAQLLGSRLAESHIDVDVVYSSPSYRCVLTATRVLTGYHNYSTWAHQHPLRIRIDSGLYECGKAESGPIAFLEPRFFLDRGCPVEMQHQNSIRDDDLRHHLWEDLPDFRKRGMDWMQRVFAQHDNADTFMFVSHASTILIFVRELLGLPMSLECLSEVINVPPNLSTLMVDQSIDGKWTLCKPQPIPSYGVRATGSFHYSWLNQTTYDDVRC